MRIRMMIVAALVGGGVGWPGLAQVAVPESMPLHRWTSISHSRPAGAPPIHLRNDGARGVRFVVTYGVRDGDPDVRPRESALVVRLHLRDGTIVQPASRPDRGQGGTCGVGACQYNYDYVFPWQENALEEAWIEGRLPEGTYWFEIPYGFTRNPADRLTPVRVLSGRPEIAPAMQAMGEHDQIVPWNYVEYEVGRIGDHWQAAVRIGNPFDTEAEVVLYRGDRLDGGTFRWDLQTPRTGITIDRSDGRRLVGQPVGLRLHDDGLHRSDTFGLARSGFAEARGWGTVTLSVDDATHRFTVPSSLFSYVHGRAATYPRPPVERVPLR